MFNVHSCWIEWINNNNNEMAQFSHFKPTDFNLKFMFYDFGHLIPAASCHTNIIHNSRARWFSIACLPMLELVTVSYGHYRIAFYCNVQFWKKVRGPNSCFWLKLHFANRKHAHLWILSKNNTVFVQFWR